MSYTELRADAPGIVTATGAESGEVYHPAGNAKGQVNEFRHPPFDLTPLAEVPAPISSFPRRAQF